ncbi:hypothetical protein [Mycolicibacterium insubricum]|nr:hypothetical protein [Mycolicibacterium insubricum]
MRANPARDNRSNGADMSVVVFVALTVAAFTAIGLVQRWVEQL